MRGQSLTWNVRDVKILVSHLILHQVCYMLHVQNTQSPGTIQGRTVCLACAACHRESCSEELHLPAAEDELVEDLRGVGLQHQRALNLVQPAVHVVEAHGLDAHIRGIRA